MRPGENPDKISGDFLGAAIIAEGRAWDAEERTMEVEEHLRADHAALRRCWRLAQDWRGRADLVDAPEHYPGYQPPPYGEVQWSSRERLWLLGAARLLEEAIKGDQP